MFSLRGYSIVNTIADSDYVNLFDLTYDAINAIEKKDLFEKNLSETVKSIIVVKNVNKILENTIVNLGKTIKSIGKNVKITGVANEIPG